MANTPNLKDRVPQGAGTYTIGTEIEAGLPNIKGVFSGVGDYEEDDPAKVVTGPFYIAKRFGGVKNANDSDSTQDDLYGFNATRCSSIYGKSNTVQPPALAVNFYIKAK